MKNGSECNPGGCHGLQSRCSDENWEVGSIPTRFRNNHLLILVALFFTLSFIFPQGMYVEKIEKPAGIANPKDFRNEVVNFVIRAKAKNKGKNPKWTSYEKLREVIEKKMFASTEELLPIISFTAKGNKDDQKKHNDFVKRMENKGYTDRQVRRLVEWYMRVQKSS